MELLKKMTVADLLQELYNEGVTSEDVTLIREKAKVVRPLTDGFLERLSPKGGELALAFWKNNLGG